LQAPPFEQGKLIRCNKGSIFDVAIDIRKGSPNFGKWEAYVMSEENGYQLYIPPGYGHGFMSLENNTEVIYKCSNFYTPKSEGSIFWDDTDIGIEWLRKFNITISEKDAKACSFKKI
tara:strand:- start:1791 stop:2141 length:351 start_codon:yes stop_codon:yes gene_type:complete